MGFVVFMLGCAAAAIPGIVFRPGAWYRELEKPSWCPPDWLYGPVWLILYVCIAVSGWFVWRLTGFHGAAFALYVYGFQLLLNGLWSVAFFGLRRPDLALFEIVFLWIFINITIVLFSQIDNTAAFILIPYVIWVTFAVALNFRIWRLNSATYH
jgi:translocator protein